MKQLSNFRTLSTRWQMPAARYFKHCLLVAGAIQLVGCAVHDTSQRERVPVEVRRGEDYGKPVYQDPYGRQAPDVNRPIYVPDQQLPTTEDYGQQEDIGYEPDPRDIRPDSPPAIARLVARAESAIQAEDYDAAAASAENALRLDPQSVDAYHTLARTYLFSERYAESEQMALRALSILRGKPGARPEVQRNLWLLIAETRRGRDDRAGAERAMEQAGGRY